MPVAHDGYGLVFVAMPKTGSEWSTAALVACGGRRLRGHHDPALSLTEDEVARLRVVGTVRDPWSWYASWYDHAMAGAGYHQTRMGRWAPSMTFRDVLYAVTHGGPPPTACGPGVIWGPYPGTSGWRQYSGEGLWTQAVREFYCRPWRSGWVGPGQSRGEPGWGGWLASLLVDAGALEDGWRRLGIVHDEPPLNTAGDRDRTLPVDRESVWDDEMVGWVREADGALAGALGYQDPWRPSRLGSLMRVGAYGPVGV